MTPRTPMSSVLRISALVVSALLLTGAPAAAADSAAAGPGAAATIPSAVPGPTVAAAGSGPTAAVAGSATAVTGSGSGKAATVAGSAPARSPAGPAMLDVTTAVGAADAAAARWLWPVDAPRAVAVPYRAPAHRFGAGHRGIDVPAVPGAVVRAPAEGIVAFRGTVVDRPLLTIEHPGGLVSTFEPLASALVAGDRVARGDPIGAVDVGGHATVGTLHLGVRLDGDYLDPMLMFDDVPRAVLLPCCGAR